MVNYSAKAPDWLLRRIRGLTLGEVKERAKGRELTVRVAGGAPIAFDLHLERPFSEERARDYVSAVRKASSSRRPLIATGRLTPAARRILRMAGVSWIEEQTGVLHLRGPGLFIDVDQDLSKVGVPTTEPHAARPARLRGLSGLCAEALLDLKYRDREFHAKDLAGHAGLSQALLSRVLRRLEGEHIVAATDDGPRWKKWRLTNPGALLDRWADEEARPQLITRVYAHAPSFRDLYAATARLRDVVECAIGGVAAANLYEPLLTRDPRPDLWIPAGVPAGEIAQELGGSIVDDGENIRLWQTPGDPALKFSRMIAASYDPRALYPCVTAQRAYVEARRNRGRGAEVADHLRARSSLGARS